jgi:hypothetical protein
MDKSKKLVISEAICTEHNRGLNTILIIEIHNESNDKLISLPEALIALELFPDSVLRLSKNESYRYFRLLDKYLIEIDVYDNVVNLQPRLDLNLVKMYNLINIEQLK